MGGPRPADGKNTVHQVTPDDYVGTPCVVVCVSIDVLGRGWSPSSRTMVAFYAVLGVGLVFVPFYGGALADALGTSDTVEYRAVEVSPAGGQLDVVGEIEALGDHGAEGIDCFRPFDEPRRCVLERALLDGNLTISGDLDTMPDDRYTYHGRLYERVHSQEDSTLEMGLRPVSADEVLTDVAVPIEDVTPATRRAIEQGRVSVRRALPAANHVVAAENGYYLIAPQSGDVPAAFSPGLGTAVLVLAGLLSLRRGHRRYQRMGE
jgi:hypothetical protein